MSFLSNFKNTVLLWVLALSACGNQPKTLKNDSIVLANQQNVQEQEPISVGANNTTAYLPLLKGKKIGVVANQTSVIYKGETTNAYTHIVDSLLARDITVEKVFAPEHGFRGKIDAGEHVKNGTDTKTGLPILSLYGKNKKPSPEQLQGLDVVLFDIQDVGVRFYTYIATLQLVMEACAAQNIPVIVLDRPNPNGHYVDGPTMEAQHTSFLGMNTIPLVYGMTIGEYAKMINEERWLANQLKVDLTVVPLSNYNHNTPYSLPIRPSPNLPNDTAINLYPSLGLFEGTNLNAGRGTEFQFQRYGASFLNKEAYTYTYTPKPNFGSTYPKEEGKLCYGRDLSKTPYMNSVSLTWLIDVYTHANDTDKVFNTTNFTKHAGTAKLQEQITQGWSEEKIKESWQPAVVAFKKIREKYLLYN